MTTPLAEEQLARLRPLLAAEAAAEAVPGAVEAADLEQAVWLRLLERGGSPPDPARWLRGAVRAEVRGATRRNRRERPYHADHDPAASPTVEQIVLDTEQRRELLAAVRRLPGRCPQVVTALLSRSDPTYREISQELGISQGSLGPLRSRCIGCLRTTLRTWVATPVVRGKAR